MKRKTHILLLASIFAALVPMTVNAQVWSTDDFTIEIPDDYYVFTAETALSDPAWDEAGIVDPIEILDLFEEDDNSYIDVISGNNTDSMYGIAYLVGNNAEVQILVTRHQTTSSLSVYTFGDLTDQERQAFLEELIGDGEEMSTYDIEYNQVAELYEEGEVPFVKLQVDAESEGNKMYEVVYMTMLNGDSITFNVYTVNEEIPQSAIQMVQEVADSFHVTRYIDQSENTMTTWELVRALLLLVLLIAVIVGTFIYIHWRNKRDKRQKKEMADRLAEYRKKNGEQEVKGKLCFANVTKCSDEAIHAFSIYHAYLKNLLQLIVGFVCCVILLIVAFSSTDEWFLIIIAVALVGYYVFRMATASSNTEKVQKKIYTRGSSDMAKYAFYEYAFRVSGIQSVTSYPYFQVTDIRSYKDHIYLYYSPDNAYIISKNGFANDADPEAFLEFIKEKMKAEDES